jgi:oligopeptide transport system permease protein
MFRYIVRRLLQGVLTFFGATFIVYALMFANQDDPLQALAGERPVTPAVRQYLTEYYHLNDSFLTQYGYYIKGLFHFDLGRSIGRNRPISELLMDAWPITIKLAVIAVIFAALLGVTAGVVAGVRRASPFDYSTLIIALILLSLPYIVLAPMAQFLFGVKLQLFPVTTGGDPSLYKLLLPGIVLGVAALATTMRLSRTSVAENLRADYVRTAKAKGLSRSRVIGVHVLRNSLIPVITYLGVSLGDLMAGAIITEGVFNTPGVGFNLFRGIRTEDGPLVVGFVSVLVIVYILANLVVDILYAVLDPRIRYD